MKLLNLHYSSRHRSLLHHLWREFFCLFSQITRTTSTRKNADTFFLLLTTRFSLQRCCAFCCPSFVFFSLFAFRQMLLRLMHKNFLQAQKEFFMKNFSANPKKKWRKPKQFLSRYHHNFVERRRQIHRIIFLKKVLCLLSSPLMSCVITQQWLQM